MTKEMREADIAVSAKEIRVMGFPLLDPGNADDSKLKRMKFESKRDLVRALCECVQGDVVPVVAFFYDKDETAGPGRVANEDYIPLPEVGDDFHFGQIIRVARSKKGNVYFKMRDLARADGINSWTWTCIRPDRIRRFQYRGSFNNPDKRSFADK